jgi:hypothetical protein
MDGREDSWNWGALSKEEQATVYKCVDKGRMSEAPNTILGMYSGLDAQSTWALYQHFISYYPRFPDMQGILEQEMMTLASLEVEEFFTGMWVDEPLLDDRIAGIELAMERLLAEFYRNSEASTWINQYNKLQYNALFTAEPPQFTKTGKVAVRYTKWQDKIELAKYRNYFNPNSKDQLAWLFYDCIFESTAVEQKFDWRGESTHSFTVTVDGIVFDVEGTRGGKRAIDKKILPKMGKAGRLLTRYNELVKLVGYMKGMKNSLRDGIHHIGLKLGGTLTFRCSGGSLTMKEGEEIKNNIQQAQKVREYLDCFKPRPGNVFIQMDVDALEPVVLAELSEDAAMMKLYGPGSPVNDIYLFVGANIPALQEEICQYGYDPTAPTPDAIARTKKKAKRLRGIVKVLKLAADYGAGAFKIWSTLIQSGVDITLEEVKLILKAYWELFADVKVFEARLKSEAAGNGGWFLDGRGMPTTVAAHLEKDTLNRCIQKTGHFNLLTYLKHLQALRRESSIVMTPCMVDFHDETIWEVREEDAERALTIFRRAWILTNKELGGIIPLSGAPEICHSFSDFKVEGGYRVAEIMEEFNLQESV